MRRIVLALLIGAAVVAAMVHFLIAPIYQAVAKVCAVLLPESVSVDGYSLAASVATNVLLAAPGLVIAVLIARRPKPKPERCAGCGYDLTDNVSERCPECGQQL